MDFKVAGTTEGITAIQMDIKVDGLTPEIIKASLERTKIDRLAILNDTMLPAISEPRPEISPHAPKIAIIRINVEQIGEVIGPRGKVIHSIIDETGVDKIDTEDDGRIFIVSKDQDKIDKAVDMIKAIVNPPEVGKHYTGKVTRLMTFGAFVEIAPGKEGLCHISQLAVERVEKVEDVVKVGDEITVKVTEIDDQGRVNLSRKAVLAPELGDGIVKRPPPRPREGGGGGFRGGDRNRSGGGDRNGGGRR